MKLTAVLTLLAGVAAAQHVTVPSTCTGDFMSGTDIVNYTVPYTYKQVMSIIGSFKNLTWSGNPPDTVKLNGTDNKVGTARTYTLKTLPGVTLVETITKYSKPSNGPYYEDHTTATFTVKLPNTPSFKVYIPSDATSVTPICGDKASRFIFTAKYCSTNVKVANGLLHEAHMGDAEMVGKMLGGETFKSCSALSSSSSPSSSAPPSLREGQPGVQMFGAGMTVVVAVFVAAALLS